MTAADDLMREHVFHGGGLFTRRELFDLMSRRPDLPERGIGSADWWAFHSPAVDVHGLAEAEIATYRAIAQRIEAGRD